MQGVYRRVAHGNHGDAIPATIDAARWRHRSRFGKRVASPKHGHAIKCASAKEGFRHAGVLTHTAALTGAAARTEWNDSTPSRPFLSNLSSSPFRYFMTHEAQYLCARRPTSTNTINRSHNIITNNLHPFTPTSRASARAEGGRRHRALPTLPPHPPHLPRPLPPLGWHRIRAWRTPRAQPHAPRRARILGHRGCDPAPRSRRRLRPPASAAPVPSP